MAACFCPGNADVECADAIWHVCRFQNDVNQRPRSLLARLLAEGLHAPADSVCSRVNRAGVLWVLSAILIGMLCERLFVRMPAISLYTSCIGALAASVFMALTLFATLLLRTSNARYVADTASVENPCVGFRLRAPVTMPCLLFA